MEEALKVIAGFPDQEAMFDYCTKHGIGFHRMEPPYLTMARIANEALHGVRHVTHGDVRKCVIDDDHSECEDL